MTDIIDKVIRASIEGHDRIRLPAEKDQLVARSWIGLQRTPDGMSQRLQKLVLEGQSLKTMDLDEFIDAVRPVANDPIQQANVAALEFVAARLGSEVMAMHIGRQIFDALRKSAPCRPGNRQGILPTRPPEPKAVQRRPTPPQKRLTGRRWLVIPTPRSAFCGLSRCIHRLGGSTGPSPVTVAADHHGRDEGQ